MRKILVSGSLAYDRIMVFPGKFSDHIMPEKIHAINVSFGIESVKQNFGGTAGNIAFNLALLHEKPLIISSAGKDFSEYGDWLNSHGVDISHVVRSDSAQTASAYILTDEKDNQITAFHAGAMKIPAHESLDSFEAAYAIIAPGNRKDMEVLAEKYYQTGTAYIFDPGQALSSFDAESFEKCLEHCRILVVNDYERAYIKKNFQFGKEDILKYAEIFITTLGDKGSVIETKEKVREISAARPASVLDPTGAGDAYRAGLIKGLMLGYDYETCGRLGSVAASFAVEKHGTQEHFFTLEDIKQRYEKNYHQDINF